MSEVRVIIFECKICGKEKTGKERIIEHIIEKHPEEIFDFVVENLQDAYFEERFTEEDMVENQGEVIKQIYETHYIPNLENEYFEGTGRVERVSTNHRRTKKDKYTNCPKCGSEVLKSKLR